VKTVGRIPLGLEFEAVFSWRTKIMRPVCCTPRPLRNAFIGLSLLVPGFLAPALLGGDSGVPVSSDSFYALKTTSLQGKPVDLGDFAGEVTLVVNVASECGFTPQYKGLQALHQEFSGKGFSVLGFPSNEFGSQEPGSPDQIQTFCQKNYGVSFPMFSKLVTKPGPAQSPIYTFLTKGGQVPSWNFCKYLVGKKGQVLAFFPSKVTPESKELRDAIQGALAQ
jgi:glutathione peroxidase